MYTKYPSTRVAPPIRAILAKHAEMWDRRLGSIQATEHRIELEPNTNPVR